MTKAAELAKMGEVLTNSQIGGRRNIIINGAMQVAQRGTSSTATLYQTVDRIRINTANTDELAFTQSQSTTTPGQGFSNSFKFEVTTKEDALASDEFANIQYRVEAQDLQPLAFGTSDAKKITLSFWVRSSLAGKYSVLFYLVDDARSNTQSFTIASADTWEYKTITLDGDTTGVIDNDYGAGLNISFILAAGDDYAGTPHSGWGAYSATEDNAFSDQVNFIAQTGTFYLTGLQMEIGEQATPFEHRSFGEELQLCKRYAYVAVAGHTYGHFGGGYATSATVAYANIPLPVEMRINPALTADGDFRNYAYSGNKPITTNPTVLNAGSKTMYSVSSTSSGGGMTAGDFIFLTANNDADAFLLFDAEL